MTTPEYDSLTRDVTAALGDGQPVAATIDAVLARVLAGFGCVAGTIHAFNPASGLLELAAHRGIPESVRERAARVPVGKGMAGIAAERREAVQVCNLQTDGSGVARPAARETPVEGAIAVPMLVDGELAGTLGVAKATEYEFTREEIDALLRLGELIGRSLRAGHA